MPERENKEYFYSLTSLRGLASFWVAIGHLSWTVPSTGLLLFLPMLRHGYLAVDFFFILSGFVLAHAYKIHLMDNWVDYLKFCKARIVRIFPIHVFILTIFSILYFILSAQNITLPGVYNFKALMAEFFLVQITPLFDPKYFFAWNYPTWTLVLEVWWFMVVVGLITLFSKYNKYTIVKNRRTWLGLVFGFMFILSGIVLYTHSPSFIDTPNFYNSLVRSGLEFVAGLFLYNAFILKPFALKKSHLTLAYTLLSVGIFMWFLKIPSFIIVAYWLILIPLILIVSIQKGTLLYRILNHYTLVYLGNISYSLYLVHGPIERVIAVIYPKFQNTSFNPAFTYLIFIFTTLTLATLSYKYIEKPLILYFKEKRLNNI
ncbi:MAG: acyltransferase [Candidatus Pacebacteria bacterium]|nr:acyltransferase [Candidatus Paceibacterota bacterium]